METMIQPPHRVLRKSACAAEAIKKKDAAHLLICKHNRHNYIRSRYLFCMSHQPFVTRIYPHDMGRRLDSACDEYSASALVLESERLASGVAYLVYTLGGKRVANSCIECKTVATPV